MKKRAADTPIHEFQSLNAVIKISERCNLNCHYCYYYRGNAKRWQKYPAVMNEDVAVDVANRLVATANQYSLKILQITLHGGEPMLAPAGTVARLLEILEHKLSNKLDLRLCIQTNATKTSDDWMALAERFKIQVGVSLDGGTFDDNHVRIHGNGKNAFPAITAGMAEFKRARTARALKALHVLCVLHPNLNIHALFQFCREHQVTTLDFLLPDLTHDEVTSHAHSPLAYGHLLVRLFKYWLNHWPQAPMVRMFAKSIGRVLNSSHQASHETGLVMTIRSDGSITHDDSFINIFNASYYGDTGIVDFFNSFVTQEILTSKQQLAPKCKSCQWQQYCGGGELIHRYSKRNTFANPSVYCQGLAYFYQQITRLTSNLRDDHGRTHS